MRAQLVIEKRHAPWLTCQLVPICDRGEPASAACLLAISESCELRLAPGGGVWMDHPLGGSLVELLDGRLDLGVQLVRVRLVGVENRLDVDLDRLLDRAIPQPSLGGLPAA